MSRTQKNPLFFLPIEIPARELDYKLEIARHICKKGWDVIFGYPPFIREELIKKNYEGIFLEKGMNATPLFYEEISNQY